MGDLMKKIYVITNVKNESDIIESFCRYNLNYCDGILIYEGNKSTDCTRDIINKLVGEGLPVFFADEVEVERYVAAKNAIAELAFSKYEADLVIPLDADEFLSHIDGNNPREVLESLRGDVEYRILWRTYVYEKEPDITQGFMPNNFTHFRNPALDIRGKTLASRFLIKEMKAQFSPGAHDLEYTGDQHAPANVEIHPKLVLSHFPLRSKAQLLNKVVPNWICKWREPFPMREGHGIQLGVIWDELKEKGDISQEKIKQYSIEYSVSDYSLTEIMPKIADHLMINGQMDTAFCQSSLQLQYTDYRDTSKTLMRAMLTEAELTLAALPKREQETIKLIEKERSYIDELTRKNNSLKQQLDENSKIVSDMYSSKSWRIGNRLVKIMRFFIPGR